MCCCCGGIGGIGGGGRLGVVVVLLSGGAVNGLVVALDNGGCGAIGRFGGGLPGFTGWVGCCV